MAVNGTNSATTTGNASDIKVVASDKIGFSGLTSEDFLNVLVKQLSNQDPTNPTDSNELLNQLSSLYSLQSNLDLSESLKTVVLGQQVSSATNFIGKEVTVQPEEGDAVTGIVNKVRIKDNTTYLDIGGKSYDMSRVTTVAPGDE